MAVLQTYRGVYLWSYVPSIPLAAVFAALFGAATVAHTWRMLKTKQWFCLPFAVGGNLEVIGYIMRVLASNATGSLGLYIMQSIFLLLPPILFAASLYMVFARVIRAVRGERFSTLSPRWTTRIFVVGDIVCLGVQGDGAGLLGKAATMQIGNHVIVAGLGVQVALFALFVVCCLAFHVRCRKHLAGATSVPWESTLYMLYATSVAILLRNVYRMAEFIMGQSGYLLSHEWPTYVFDGAFMLLVMIGFLVFYPSRLEPDDKQDSMIGLADCGSGSA